MSLLDRYIHAVRKHLPAKQRDDIGAELYETLQAEFEDAAQGAGRALNENEQAAILKRFGHPLLVASRYGAREYLIGPTVFPFYKFALKVTAWIMAPLAVLVLVVAALTAGNPWSQVPLTVWMLSTAGLALFGLITLSFARIERLRDHVDLVGQWDPRELSQDADGSRSPHVWEPVGSMLLVAFYLLWWIGVLPLGNLNRWLGGSPSGVGLAPIWDVMNVSIIAIMVASLVADAIRIVWPTATKWHAAAALAINVAAVIVLLELLRSPTLLVATSEPPTALVRLFEQFTRIGLGGLVVAAIVNAGRAIRRLARTGHVSSVRPAVL